MPDLDLEAIERDCDDAENIYKIAADLMRTMGAQDLTAGASQRSHRQVSTIRALVARVRELESEGK